jgi:DnaJ-class molecular chaperone
MISATNSTCAFSSTSAAKDRFMQADHYATLGLHHTCTGDEIRKAYRLLSKTHHPDVNASAPEAIARTQAINAAYHVLGNDARRSAYDRELERERGAPEKRRAARRVSALKQDAQVTIRELIAGTNLRVRVHDPARAAAEEYTLVVPPDTAPGTRFRIQRDGDGGTLVVRVKVKPDRQFKARGSDLRCDLRINARRAASGGAEHLRGPLGQPLSIRIPPRVERDTLLRIPGAGLPTARGARGDLVVRIRYRPDIRITSAR